MFVPILIGLTIRTFLQGTLGTKNNFFLTVIYNIYGLVNIIRAEIFCALFGLIDGRDCIFE